jgi:hypothetical protein
MTVPPEAAASGRAGRGGGASGPDRWAATGSSSPTAREGWPGKRPGLSGPETAVTRLDHDQAAR